MGDQSDFFVVAELISPGTLGETRLVSDTGN